MNLLPCKGMMREMAFDIFTTGEFWMYVLVGFAAQMVDGALGMAYGTLSTSVLLSAGLPPLTVSASVHTAQFFTTGFSALAHSWFRNVHMGLLWLLAASGGIGGILGALLLTHINGVIIKPWIAAYLFALGLFILWKRFYGYNSVEKRGEEKAFKLGLGFIGGFFDALGGGGWGPTVTSSLIARNEDPRLVIGTVNTAEFFVKTMIAATFIAATAFNIEPVVLGLLLGGIIAAPLGAYVLRFIRAERLITGIGFLIIFLSASILFQTFFK